MDEYPSAYFLLQYSFPSLAMFPSHLFTIFLSLSLVIFLNLPHLVFFPIFLSFPLSISNLSCAIFPSPLGIRYCSISLSDHFASSPDQPPCLLSSSPKSYKKYSIRGRVSCLGEGATITPSPPSCTHSNKCKYGVCIKL